MTDTNMSAQAKESKMMKGQEIAARVRESIAPGEPCEQLNKLLKSLECGAIPDSYLESPDLWTAFMSGYLLGNLHVREEAVPEAEKSEFFRLVGEKFDAVLNKTDLSE